MKHLAAYMLLQLAGNASPSADDVTKLLKDSGIAADKDALKTLVEKMSGKKTHELVAEGRKQFASMPAGGAAAPATAAPAGGAQAAPAKKEEKKAEPEEDLDMGDLFGY